jgi:hypothetical protein
MYAKLLKKVCQNRVPCDMDCFFPKTKILVTVMLQGFLHWSSRLHGTSFKASIYNGLRPMSNVQIRQIEALYELSRINCNSFVRESKDATLFGAVVYGIIQVCVRS